MNEFAHQVLIRYYKHYCQKAPQFQKTVTPRSVAAKLYLLNFSERLEFRDVALEAIRSQSDKNEAGPRNITISDEILNRFLDNFVDHLEDISELKHIVSLCPGLVRLLDENDEKLTIQEIPLLPSVGHFAEKFDFTEDEVQLLNLLTIVHTQFKFFRYFPINLNIDHQRSGVSMEFILMVFDWSERHLFQVIGRRSRIRSLQIIDVSERMVKVTPTFIEYLLEETDLHLEGEHVDHSCAPALGSFQIQESELTLMQELLRAPGRTNILLRGAPGTGKSTLALSLAKALKLKAFRLSSPEELESKSHQRESLLASALYLHGNRESLLIVDEADSLVSTANLFSFATGTQRDRKAWLNQILEGHQAKVIFICNDGLIDDSTLRRFNLVRDFRSASAKQREAFWREVVTQKNISWLPPHELKHFTENFNLSMGIVTQAIQDVERMRPTEPLKTLEAILSLQKKGIYGEAHRSARPVSFNPRFTKTSQDLEALITKAKRLTELGPGRLAYLLTGLPGTGKTAFARHLANAAGLDLVVKTYAELSSKYVGETEKLIQHTFLEAQEQGVALFIDEVDGLLQNRAGAQRSWEITQVNQFLTALENFQGLFLAATNNNHALDPAVLRRFTDKIEFQVADLDVRVEMVREMLGEKVTAWPTDEELRGALKSRPLTPGDVHALRESLAFQDKLPWPEILARLTPNSKANQMRLV